MPPLSTANATRPPATAKPEAGDRPSGPRNVDKRTARRNNHEAFAAAIAEWRAAHPTKGTKTATVADGASPPNRLRAIVRKRPLFLHERDKAEFDVLSVRGNDVIVHNCLMAPNATSMFMVNTAFKSCAEVFDESADNGTLCKSAISPLLANVLSGGSSTVFMFGQTGSGKSHTMSGIEEYAAAVLVPEASAQAPVAGHLSFFEIAGSKCLELLGDAPGSELQLMQGADGRVTPVGAARVAVTSAAQLLEIIALAKSRRATSATAANAVSSRSHAVCQLTLTPPAASSDIDVCDNDAAVPPRAEVASAPVLTLVDCAGTERKEDNDHHDAAQRKEGAEINASLHALKECMRHWAAAADGAPTHIPFRESALTRVLAESFLRTDTLLAVVGTLSPAAADTEHSISTLRTVVAAAGSEANVSEAKAEVRRPVDPATVVPAKWSEERTRAWLAVTVATMPQGGGKLPLAGALSSMPRGTDGKALMAMTVLKMKNVWKLDEQLANGLYTTLRLATKAAEEAAKAAKKAAAGK